MKLPEGSHMLWATALMVEMPNSDSGRPCELYVWPAEKCSGTPLYWLRTGTITCACLGAQHPCAISPDVLSANCVQRLFTDASLARELTGVFSLMAIDSGSNKVIAVGDRLGVQSAHYGGTHREYGEFQLT